MELLLKALTYAKALVNINDEEIDTIMHSRKSLLLNNTYIWIKKNGDPILTFQWRVLTEQNYGS